MLKSLHNKGSVVTEMFNGMLWKRKINKVMETVFSL